MNLRTVLSRFTSHSLLQSSAIVFTGTMAANVLSYLYHLVMGRLLGPSGYGELSSLLSLLYITTVPLLVSQTVLVKFVSGFKAQGDIGEAKSLLLKVTKLFLIVSVLLTPIIMLLSPYVSLYLHLSSPLQIRLLFALLVISLLTVAPSSMLTGFQKFLWVSILGASVILFKLVISIPFAVWGVTGAMTAAVVAGVITFVIYIFPLRFILKVRSQALKLRFTQVAKFALPTLLTQLGIISLFSTDIILVRHYTDANTSGIYAAIAILGKIIFYASSAVPMVLFPIASERVAKGESSRKLILTGVALITMISLILTCAYFLFPQLIVQLLFGASYTGAGQYLGLFGIFISLFSVANSITLTSLALGKTAIWIFPVISAVAQIIGITLYHATIYEVLYINIGISIFFVLSVYWFFNKNTHEKI